MRVKKGKASGVFVLVVAHFFSVPFFQQDFFG
jgi:hypothetical protein